MNTNLLPLSGFRDFSPEEQAGRLWLIEQALSVYRQFGYLPIETPALERNEILTGQYGEEGDHLRYTFTDHEKRLIGLRYDLTIPLARFIARFADSGVIQLPFRRSQVAPVWRKESPQAGRFREFYQCDADIAGSSDPSTDAEILLIAFILLKKLGLDFRLKLSHRGLLDAILHHAGLTQEQHIPTLIILDKLEKIGREAVVAELKEKAGLNQGQLEPLFALIESGNNLESLRSKISTEEQVALNNLLSIVHLAQAAVDEPARIQVDLPTVRGLAYYTGLVVEATLVSGGTGSLMAGGRYDNSIGTFLGRQIPAVGISLGVDRTLTALAEQKLLPTELAKAELAVLPFPETTEYAFALAQRLRGHGISTILFPGSDNLANMLGFAERTARQALIIGTQEKELGKLKLKNLATREQKELDESELQQYFTAK